MTIPEVTDQTRWEKLLEEDALQDFQETPDEGVEVEVESHLKLGDTINVPSTEAPLRMEISDMAFKGYVELWDTQTGRKILQPKNILWQIPSMKQKDGSQMYTRRDPHIEPNYGAKLFCALHPDSPDYSRLQGMGFKDCRKHNIPHEAARMEHLQKSHKRAFAALEREREDRIREEDRDLQREVLTAMTGAAVKGIANESSGQPATETQEFSATCPDCGIEKTGNSKRRANAKIKMHRPHCKALKT